MTERDRKIAIPGPKICARVGCGKSSGLEREHILPLYKGGKDESVNLQWLCRACHRLKHCLEKLIERDLGLAEKKFGKDSWQYELTQYRIKIANELNPPGSSKYTKYWTDETTHYSYWYYRNVIVRVKQEQTPSITLESFLEVST